MAISTETLAAAMGYTKETVEGAGAIKGKNCVITDISPITGGNRVTFQWTLDNGTVQSDTMDVMDGEDGLGIKSVDINASNHLIVTYDDDTTYDAGEVSGGGGGSEPTVITYEQWQALTPQQQADGNYIVQNYPGSGGSASWGDITGTLANQTDLQTALDEKLDASEMTITESTNLFVYDDCKTNWKPSNATGATYNDGAAETSIMTSNLIPCTKNARMKCSLTSVPTYLRFWYYDSEGVYIGANTGDNRSIDTDGYLAWNILNNNNVAYFYIVVSVYYDPTLPVQWQNLSVNTYDNFSPVRKAVVNDLYFSDNNVSMAKDRLGLADDILYGKKWAVAGDSFTAGGWASGETPTLPNGKYMGQPAVYAYLIGNRCNMTIQDLSKGGRTLALPSGETSSYNSFVNHYQSVAADADYLTIYLGINDSHQSATIPLGTISDNTTDTFYGAWNVILSWLIENRPNLHIGIIVSNGCETDDYRTATIAIAQKYGIPYIDMNGDKQTPCMMRSSNTSIASAVRHQRTANWRISEENQHPNAACHAFESVFFENFLRSL